MPSFLVLFAIIDLARHIKTVTVHTNVYNNDQSSPMEKPFRTFSQAIENI